MTIYREQEARERFPEGGPLPFTTVPGAVFLSLHGILKRLTYEERECERCGGDGFVGFRTKPCPACLGTGTGPPPPEVLKFAREFGL
jgi:hypothetical protein